MQSESASIEQLRAALREQSLLVDIFGWLNWSEIEFASNNDTARLLFQLSVHAKNLSSAKYAAVVQLSDDQVIECCLGIDQETAFAGVLADRWSAQEIGSFSENPGKIQHHVFSDQADPALGHIWWVPLDGQTRRFGVLALSALHSGEPLDASVELNLHLVANAVARLMERAHLIQQLYQSNKQLALEKEAEKKLAQRLQQAQDQLVQSEKLASIGQLAAGVAHEINNPVGFLTANMTALNDSVKDLFAVIDAFEAVEQADDDCEQAASRLSEVKEKADLDYLRDDLPKLITESREGLSRVKRIVRDLKNFSHVEQAEFRAADLNAGLRSTLNIVYNDLKYKAKVHVDLGDVPPVECIISQLNQVFMNLLVNAGHAIEKDGRIEVSSRVADGWVIITVSDNGCGIPENVRKRIFEPFFTTKPVGKGTGLGLSLSYGIVEHHHGRIVVESKPGSGSCFKVILPVAQPRAPG